MENQTKFNVHGDVLVPTTGVHGGDIASQRFDELDCDCLKYALESCPDGANALELGCGLGTQGIRLAMVGLNTLLIDIHDIDERVSHLRNVLPTDKLHFLRKDVRALTPEDLPEPIHLCYSQRFIHYLNHQEAKFLIDLLSSKMANRSRLFISASGLHSELGNSYAHASLPIENRYGTLSLPVAVKHDIREPICLYTEQELSDLITPHGFRRLRVWTSAFGNIKGEFEKT